jgi:hypothetical protein
MHRLFKITIDLKRLREHLSAQEGHALSDADVLAWLHDAGFKKLDDHWQVAEPDLGQLEEDEVLSASVIAGESESDTLR